MGVREQVETVKRLVPYCDICGRDCPTTYQHSCFVCGRKGGYCCIRGQQLAGKNGKLLELFVSVCTECAAAGKDVCGETYPESIRTVIAAADARVSQLRGAWKDWSEERRNRK